MRGPNKEPQEPETWRKEKAQKPPAVPIYADCTRPSANDFTERMEETGRLEKQTLVPG